MSIIERISPKQIYLIAVSTLIILIVSNQLLIQKILEEKKDDATVINLAGRQRMLSQKIAKNVYLAENSEIDLEVLRSDVEKWVVTHEGLKNGDDELGIKAIDNEEIKALFSEIEPHHQKIKSSLSSISDQQDVINTIPILQNHEMSFLLKMDEIVDAFESISNDSVRKLIKFEIALGVFSLLVLGIEFFLVFKVFLSQINSKNEELEINSKRLEEAQEIAKIGNWNWDMKEDVITWSNQNYKIFGQTKDFNPNFEQLNALIPEEEREPFQKDVERAIAENELHDFIHRIVLNNGEETRYIHERGRVFYNEKGEPYRMAGTSQDVTESVLKELKLEAKNREILKGLDLLSQTQNIAKIGSWEVDLKTMTAFWSDQVYRIHEVEIGTPIKVEEGINFYREDFREVIQEVINDAIENKSSWDEECVLVTQNGKEIWVRAIGYPFFENEELVGLRGLFMDIDDRKRASLELDEVNEKLQLSVEAGQIAIWLWDLETNVLEWNQQAYKVFGVPDDFEPTFEKFGTMVHPEDLDYVVKETERTIETGEKLDIEFRWNRPDGNEIILSGKGDLVKDENGKPKQMIGINMDITDRYGMLETLKKQESQLRSFVEQAPVAVAMFDTGMNYITVSNKWFEHNKIEGESIIGRSHYEVLPQVAKRKDWVEIHKRVLNGEELSSEKDQFIRKDGSQIWINWAGIPWYNKEMEIGGMILYVADISKDVEYTEQLEDEIKERTEQIRKQADNLEIVNKELEAFSYSISHDLRAPLRSINGFSDILLEDYSDQLDEEGKRLMGIVKESAVNMGQLIDDILKFSRLGKQKIQKSNIDMTKLFKDICESELKLFDSDNVELSISDLPDTKGDLALIKQVVVNLVSNAFKYSSKSKKIEIEIGFEKNENNQIIYYIRDNGTGFKMEYHDKLFGVFQRLHTKSEFEGTGVGLAIVKRIINKHGGRIWAESEEGIGSTFFFLLPNH